MDLVIASGQFDPGAAGMGDVVFVVVVLCVIVVGLLNGDGRGKHDS